LEYSKTENHLVVYLTLELEIYFVSLFQDEFCSIPKPELARVILKLLCEKLIYKVGTVSVRYVSYKFASKWAGLSFSSFIVSISFILVKIPYHSLLDWVLIPHCVSFDSSFWDRRHFENWCNISTWEKLDPSYWTFGNWIFNVIRMVQWFNKTYQKYLHMSIDRFIIFVIYNHVFFQVLKYLLTLTWTPFRIFLKALAAFNCCKFAPNTNWQT